MNNTATLKFRLDEHMEAMLTISSVMVFLAVLTGLAGVGLAAIAISAEPPEVYGRSPNLELTPLRRVSKPIEDRGAWAQAFAAQQAANPEAAQ